MKPWPMLVLAAALFPACARDPETAEKSARLRPSSEDTRAALAAVIEGQLDSFRRGDYGAARAFAATPLRTRFNDETFEIMIRRGYPVIAQNTAALCHDAKDDGRRAALEVRVTAQSGEQTWFRYDLLRERDGWRISGVTAIHPPVVTA